MLPREELDRIDTKILDQYYKRLLKESEVMFMNPNTFPTKGNLILAKNSLALARQGYELMDKKRNILIRELMGLDRQGFGYPEPRSIPPSRTAYAALQKANVRAGYSMW